MHIHDGLDQVVLSLSSRRSSPTRVTCGTSRSSCGCVGWLSLGTPVFAPPTNWLVSIWVVILKGALKWLKKTKNNNNNSQIYSVSNKCVNHIASCQHIYWTKKETSHAFVFALQQRYNLFRYSQVYLFCDRYQATICTNLLYTKFACAILLTRSSSDTFWIW